MMEITDDEGSSANMLTQPEVQDPNNGDQASANELQAVDEGGNASQLSAIEPKITGGNGIEAQATINEHQAFKPENGVQDNKTPDAEEMIKKAQENLPMPQDNLPPEDLPWEDRPMPQEDLTRGSLPLNVPLPLPFNLGDILIPLEALPVHMLDLIMSGAGVPGTSGENVKVFTKEDLVTPGCRFGFTCQRRKSRSHDRMKAVADDKSYRLKFGIGEEHMTAEQLTAHIETMKALCGEDHHIVIELEGILQTRFSETVTTTVIYTHNTEVVTEDEEEDG